MSRADVQDVLEVEAVPEVRRWASSFDCARLTGETDQEGAITMIMINSISEYNEFCGWLLAMFGKYYPDCAQAVKDDGPASEAGAFQTMTTTQITSMYLFARTNGHSDTMAREIAEKIIAAATAETNDPAV